MESLARMYRTITSLLPVISSQPISDDWVDSGVEGESSPNKKPDPESKSKTETAFIQINAFYSSNGAQPPTMPTPHSSSCSSTCLHAVPSAALVEPRPETAVTTSSPSLAPKPMPTAAVLFSPGAPGGAKPEKDGLALLELSEEPGSASIAIPEPEKVVQTPVHAIPVPVPIEQKPIVKPPQLVPVVLDPRTSAHRKGY